MQASGRRPRGRPRDRSIDVRIIDAALAVIAERGVGAASMDEIAQRSGVSKPTIYQRWPSKELLCVEALGRVETPPLPATTGDARRDCERLLADIAGAGIPERSAILLPRILAESASNPELANIFAERVIAPRRAQCAQLVHDAIARRQLSRTTDVDVAVDMLVGPVFYRRLVANAGAPDPRFPRNVVDAVWTAFAS